MVRKKTPTVDFKKIMENQKNTKTLEDLYQKKTPLEHILLRPDTYIGSVEKETQSLFVLHDNTDNTEIPKCIKQKQITYVPGLYKIFDEILVNAADNKTRDNRMNILKIDITDNIISVYNNGEGIPIQIHKKENVYIPELIFGHLHTSSNYDDTEKKITGGRNGYGAKLCNIFSLKFVVETANGNKKFTQTYENNMSTVHPPIITSYRGPSYTKITFTPDLPRFNMSHLDSDILSLLYKRVYDMAGILKHVKVFLNEERIEIKNFKQYTSLYNTTTNIIHQVINERWEVAFMLSEEQFQQVSFVNSICTSKGGTHVTHVLDQIVEPIIEQAKKKDKSLDIKPFQVKSNIFIFINCLIENPAFDSQTKECLTLRMSNFGSKCHPITDFVKNIIKNSNILERVSVYAKAKQMTQLKKSDGSKSVRLSGIPKLDDANMAGTKESSKCTLILTEGDSAKALAVAGLSVVGRDHYGVFPLRGKLLNVREATHKQIMDNQEISNIKKILGLQQNKTYLNTDSLRYGHIMIMTDQDHDGSHIKGLIINFFDVFFPSLLKIPNFLQEFITPILRVTFRNKNILDFYTIPEYEKWKNDLPPDTVYTVKYYKGLGTSTSTDAKMYFSNLNKHVKTFDVLSENDSSNVDLAFNKKKADNRKVWLKNMVTGTYLDNSMSTISISDFVNKELILFSMADNVRSIPSVIDGLKPGQRKVLFSCFKRNLRTEIKVAQLAGYVSEHSAYHHGEQSLCSTIVNLAQDFVGSNNLNLLMPNGQFGTRILGGKDAASSRYIFTCLNPLTRYLFVEQDDPLLSYYVEDNQSIEPEYYLPIIPMVLINGSEGIGTGWSTQIPNYSVTDVVNSVIRYIDGKGVIKMTPSYRGFKGIIEETNDTTVGDSTVSDNSTGNNTPTINPSCKYRVTGMYTTNSNMLTITELPVGVWTQPYKEYLENMISEGSIKDFKEYHTERTVYFNITLSTESKNKDGVINKSSKSKSNNNNTSYVDGTLKRFKLLSTINTYNMVCFDNTCSIKKYNSIDDIIKEFYNIRLLFYVKRKEHMLKVLATDLVKLSNRVRFIRGVVGGDVIINKRKKESIVCELRDKGYCGIVNDVVVYKGCYSNVSVGGDVSDINVSDNIGNVNNIGDSNFNMNNSNTTSSITNITVDSTDTAISSSNNFKSVVGDMYDYLLNMQLMSLTEERISKLEKEYNNKKMEYEVLMGKSVKDMWKEDLYRFMEEYRKVFKEEERKYEDECNNRRGVGKVIKKRRSNNNKGDRNNVSDKGESNKGGNRKSKGDGNNKSVNNNKRSNKNNSISSVNAIDINDSASNTNVTLDSCSDSIGNKKIKRSEKKKPWEKYNVILSDEDTE